MLEMDQRESSNRLHPATLLIHREIHWFVVEILLHRNQIKNLPHQQQLPWYLIGLNLKEIRALR